MYKDINLSKPIKVECLDCGHQFYTKDITHDDLGYCSGCPKCGSSFDIDEDDVLYEDIKEKNMDRIIDGKDLINEKIEVYKDGTMKIHKPSGKFIPKMDEEYCYIDDYGGVVCVAWDGCSCDNWRLKHYKLFRTEEECEDYKWFLEQVDKYSYEFSNDEWNDGSIVKYSIEYDCNIHCSCWSYVKYTNNVYFKSGYDRETFVNTVGEERIKRYMFNIWD